MKYLFPILVIILAFCLWIKFVTKANNAHQEAMEYAFFMGQAHAIVGDIYIDFENQTWIKSPWSNTDRPTRFNFKTSKRVGASDHEVFYHKVNQ